MAQKKITDLQLISALTDAINFPVDNTTQTYRATIAQVKDWVTKLTTRGDLMYRGASDNARLAKGTLGQWLRQGADDPEWSSHLAPTVQKFLSTGTTVGYAFVITSGNATVGATYTNNGNTYTVIATIAAQTIVWMSNSAAPQASGTLTKSAGTGDATLTFSSATPYATFTLATSPRTPLYIRVRAVAGGGGGSGSGTSDGTAAAVGKNTFFGAALIQCNGGTFGTRATRGIGGTSSLGTGPSGIVLDGEDGRGQNFQGITTTTGGKDGGDGGGTPFAGAGAGGNPNDDAVGKAAKTNSGGGGGGAGVGNAASTIAGCGGGAGGFVDCIISSPSATYPYIVGSGGAAGGAGTSGHAGGAGAAGIIEVTEYYQ